MASKTIKTPMAIKMMHKILFRPKLASEIEESVLILAALALGVELLALDETSSPVKSLSSSNSPISLSVVVFSAESSEVVLAVSFSISLYKLVVSAFAYVKIELKSVNRAIILNNFVMIFIPPKNPNLNLSYTKNQKKSIPFAKKVWIFRFYRNRFAQNSVIMPNKFMTVILSTLFSATRLTEAICSSFK